MSKEELEELLDLISYHYQAKREALAKWINSGKTSRFHQQSMRDHEHFMAVYIGMYNDKKNSK